MNLSFGSGGKKEPRRVFFSPNRNDIVGTLGHTSTSTLSDAMKWRLALHALLVLLVLLVLPNGARANTRTNDHNNRHHKKRILVLISDTGGGHRASAEALADALHSLKPDAHDVAIVDMWTDYGNWPYNKFVDGYRASAKTPIIWKTMYYATVVRPIMACNFALAELTSARNFEQCLREHDPHLVVSAHPLCQHIPIKLMEKMGGGKRRIPFATVVTDLGGAHPTWFCPSVDLCFVPSDAVRDIGRKCGMAVQQLRQYGLPTRPAFWRETPPRERLSKELNLASDRKTVLLVGGGDGVGSLDSIVTATAREVGKTCRDEAQLVVICGKNSALRAKLDAKSARGGFRGVEVRARGFTSRMSDYMAVADCLVTKAGPGTIAEACIRGVPTMLSSFLPGQEAGNVPFVTQNGFGEYSSEPRVIGKRVAGWLNSPAKLREMSANARAMAAPRASTEIAADLLEMLEGSRGSLVENEALAAAEARRASASAEGAASALLKSARLPALGRLGSRFNRFKAFKAI